MFTYTPADVRAALAKFPSIRLCSWTFIRTDKNDDRIIECCPLSILTLDKVGMDVWKKTHDYWSFGLETWTDHVQNALEMTRTEMLDFAYGFDVTSNHVVESDYEIMGAKFRVELQDMLQL